MALAFLVSCTVSSPSTTPSSGSTRRASTPSSRTPSTDPTVDELLAAHNQARASVDVAPLTWSEDVARSAQAWAKRLARKGCELEHTQGGRYGENLYWSSHGASPSDVVGSWVDERRDYNPRSNKCRGVCGHYTQVVWRASKQVGCGSARCGEQEVWVCQYDPPGNFVGEKPY